MSDQPVVLHVRPDSVCDGRLPGTVRTANTVDTAIDELAEATPDYVVCDHAPEADVDGLSLLESVRRTHPELPVVLCTNDPDGTVAARATQLGVTEYLPRSETAPADRIRALDGTADGDPLSQTAALEALSELTADHDRSDEGTIARVLELGADRLGLSLGYMSRIEDQTYQIAHVVGDHPDIEAGLETALSNTYCSRTVETDGVLDINDAPDEGWGDHPSYQMTGLACYLGDEIRVNGELYGTLCFADESPRAGSFTESQRTFIGLLTRWVSRELERRVRERDLEYLEDIIEAVDDGVYALDDDGNFQFVNETMTALTGYSEAELLGSHTSLVKPPEVVAEAEEIVREMLFGDRAEEETFDLALQRADGEQFPAEDHMTLLWDDDGDRITGTAGVVRDITAQKERDQRLSGLLETTRSLMQAETPDDVAETVVRAAERDLGFGLNLVRLHDEETDTLRPVAGSDTVPDRPTYDADEALPGRAFQRGESIRVDDFDRVEHWAGDAPNAAMYVPLDGHGVLSVALRERAAFTDADVSVAEILASNAAAALDRVAREQDLRRYETVIENVRDMVYVLDSDGTFQLVTEPLAEWLGYDRAELRGRDPGAVLDSAARGAFADRIQNLRDIDSEGTFTMEATLLTADGGERPAELEVSLIEDDIFRGSAGVVRDRTELKQTREELRDERDRFSYLFNNLPDAVAETEFVEEDAVIRSVNPAFAEVFGTDDAVLGSALNDAVVPPAHSDERETDRLADQGTAGDPVQSELRRRTADGYRDFLFRGIPYRRDDGRLWSFGIYTDITEQKERQRRLEVLNRVLRHNLRNDLTVVMGLADELTDRVDDAERLELLDSLREKAAQIASLSDRAREIERSVSREGTDIASLDIPTAVESLAETYERQYEMDVELSLPAEPARGGDGRFRRALGELIENSFEHGGKSPAVDVTVTTTPDTVSVTVADDGPGIPDHELAVLTGDEPITQLSHGSGLGLWLVIWLTESYGGHVRFDDDDGAVVTVTVPRADS